MKQIPSLPVELLADIVSYLTPHTPVIGHDAAWTHPSDLLNWWDGQSWKYRSREALHNENDFALPGTLVEIAVSPYASLLALRQANKQFNAICVPLLYKDFNCLKPRTTYEDVAAEILSLYHPYVRTVRTRGFSQRNPLLEKDYKHLLPFLTQGVTTLGVYYDYGVPAQELKWFTDEIVRVLETGHITSFGIYSDPAFSEYIDADAPWGARSLLQRVTITAPLLRRLTSLDIVVEEMDEGPYDTFRTQIGQLDSLTVRAALQDNLVQVWDTNQRHKWFPCHNLTNLQLIQCTAVSAPHIPHLLQFFPSLRTLALVSCGGLGAVEPPQQGKGFAKDSVWRGRAPLESLHIEHMYEWEVKVLGVIHTRELTISTIIDDEGIVNSFRDEDIYPGLQTLRTTRRHVNSELEDICARRGIAFASNARALIFRE